MWKNIKKFFKWIADHTGISWVARKISSGWKWLFGGKKSETSGAQQNVSQQGKFSDDKEQTLSKTLDNEVKPKQPHDELPVIGGISENTNGVLELFVTTNHTDKVFGGDVSLSGNTDLNYTEVMDKLKYRVYIKCEKGGVFQITYKFVDVNEKGAFLSIESVGFQDGKALSSEPEEMKSMLGLSNEHTTAIITQISKDPITVLKGVANGDENKPRSENANPITQQHTFGTDLSVDA